MTYIIENELWDLSKKIHEEIYFQTQLRTGTSSVVETIEKYEKNLKSKRRMTLLNSLGTIYVIGVVSLIPLISLLQFLSIEKTPSNINQQIFTNSLIFGIYNLYIFFILCMGGLMYYVTFMNGKYFKLLHPLPLNPKELSQLSFFVFFRMNMIQVTFILFALPTVGLLLTFNPIVFFILFLNNLVNIFFIIFALIIFSWFLAQRVFNTLEKSPWGSLITILTMIVYGITVIPIFFLMSKIINIITDIFNSSIGIGISQQTNEFLSLIPFPLSSGYFTSLCLLFPSTSIPTSVIFSTIVGFGIYLALICLVIIKGTLLVGKLNMEKDITSKKNLDTLNSPVSIKSSSPRIKLIRMNLLLVFRDYSALTLFVMALFFPILIVIISVIWPKRYMGGGIRDFVTTMLFFTSGITSLLFFNGSKISERNLRGVYSSLPIKEIDIFRSKQLITTLGSLFPLSLSFIILNLMGLPITFLTTIKIILLYIIISTELLLLHALLFGRFNDRYTLTLENSENELIKLGILFTLIFITIISYLELITLLSRVTSVTAELGISIILAFIFFLGLNIITKYLFKESSIILLQK